MLIALDEVCGADTFVIPRPLAYFDPADLQSYFAPSNSTVPIRNSRRLFVSNLDFHLDSAAYVMDQVAICSTHPS
jgi:hypothetical protein